MPARFIPPDRRTLRIFRGPCIVTDMETNVRHTTGTHMQMTTSMMTTIEMIICWPAGPGVC